MFWGKKGINIDSNHNYQTKPKNSNQKSVTMEFDHDNNLLKAET